MVLISQDLRTEKLFRELFINEDAVVQHISSISKFNSIQFNSIQFKQYLLSSLRVDLTTATSVPRRARATIELERKT